MKKPRWLLLSVVVALLAALVVPQAAADSDADVASDVPPGTPVADPVTESPVPSDLGLVLKEFAQFPKSEPNPVPVDPRLMRHARINHLSELPDGSGRMAVSDLNGKLYLLPKAGGTPHPYIDVGATFAADDFFSGRGLGSGFGFTTFHPDFKTNGKLYTVHTERGPSQLAKTPDLPGMPGNFLHSVVTEWTASNPAASTFSGTRREVLRLAFNGQIHAIQQIDFNYSATRGEADYGKLYLAVGDGGSGWNSDWPQDKSVPQGKILRIDPLGRNSANGKYGIPADNPFVGTPGAIGEIYAVGMRDPHRFAWDTGGNRAMYLGHIGEHANEGVYKVDSGDNFGWSEREGSYAFDQTDRCFVHTVPADDAKFGYDYPVAEFDHNPPTDWSCTSDSGHAISGGQVYRGQALKGLTGRYIFGDLVDGRVFSTNTREMDDRIDKTARIEQLQTYDVNGNRLTLQQLVGSPRVDLRFAKDASGELYFLAKATGKIWKIVGTKRAPATLEVEPSLARNMVAHYDFDHPFPQNISQTREMETDRGSSNTYIDLVNGLESMRAANGGAFPGSANALQTMQVSPDAASNDDWKAGIFREAGQPTLRAFNAAKQTTVMGWFKLMGDHPNPNSNTADPADRYNATGLAGILSGNSDGHGVRALLEVINVNGEQRLVALGRRVDTGASQTFAANEDWRTLLPQGQWVHLAATFDFSTGTMALYKNGERLSGFYTTPGDPWALAGTNGTARTSATDPRGIKIGGSFPQNTREQNPCNCQMDSLMFLDKAADPGQVKAQYRRMVNPRP